MLRSSYTYSVLSELSSIITPRTLISYPCNWTDEYTPRNERERWMYELGNKIAANGQPFLTQDQIEELIKQRRGGR